MTKTRAPVYMYLANSNTINNANNSYSQIGVQFCGHGPQVFVVKSGGGIERQDANNYHVISWPVSPALGWDSYACITGKH